MFTLFIVICYVVSSVSGCLLIGLLGCVDIAGWCLATGFTSLGCFIVGNLDMVWNLTLIVLLLDLY